MKPYILLADKEESLCNLQKTALSYFYGGDVIKASNEQEIVGALHKFGAPELLLLQIELLEENAQTLSSEFEKLRSHFPIIVCSSLPTEENLKKSFPLVTSIVERPLQVEQFTSLVKSIVDTPLNSIPSHVSLDLTSLIEIANGQFDFYLRLSGKNYVKLIKKGDLVGPQDIKKLEAKGISEVHITASDMMQFLKLWESKLNFGTAKVEIPPAEAAALAMNALEKIEGISKALGWPSEVVIQARGIISEAVGALSRNTNLAETLKKRLSGPSSSYTMHVGMLSYTVCMLASHLGMVNEGGQIKLAMAALLHDLSVDEDYYHDISYWNDKAGDAEAKDPEVNKYRHHPYEAANVAKSLDVLPPDVDLIILQHHERMNGEGFPRGLTAGRISYLSTIFIMAEDLVDQILTGESIESSLRNFVVWGANNYTEGNFKKIFEVFRNKIVFEY